MILTEGPPGDAECAALAERVFADNIRTTGLMAEEIAKAQLALRDAHSLLALISVGGDDGEMSPEDLADATHELTAARRALRHLARIMDGHADDLEALTATRRVAIARTAPGPEAVSG
jgi:hypothetical protein